MKKQLLLFLLIALFSSLILASDYFVVGEVFKSTTCGYCPSAQAGLQDLFDQHERVVPLTWYTGSSITSPGVSTRGSLYNLDGVPHAQFGGTLNVVGGYSSGSMYSAYLPKYNQLIGYTSPMEISMSLEFNSQGQLVVNSSVEVTEAFTESNNKIYTFLTLDGPSNPRFLVVRYHEQNFELTTVGETQTYSTSFDVDPAWNIEDIRAVAIVQTLGNPKRILQANYTGFTGTVSAFAADITQGPPTLFVNFMDYSLPNGGITSWAWDFDNDGNIDSNEQNPSWLFDEPGSYTVSLTVTTDDETAEPVTTVMEDFITVSNPDNVSGLVAGQWSSEYSPYTIVGDIEIPTDLSLIIHSGTTLIFDDNVILNVSGKLEVIGEKDNEVIFTSNDTWKGIYIVASEDTSTFKYAVFNNANNSALRSSMSNIYVEACQFLNNTSTIVGPAIDISNSLYSEIIGSYFANNNSSNNAGAINVSGSNVLLKNNVIVNNTGRNAGAVFFKNNSNLEIENCTIYNNLNTVSTGGTLLNSMSSATVKNSIINGDAPIYELNGLTDVSYTCIPGLTGIGNIEDNPLFVLESDGTGSEFETNYEDWYLSNNSPCIDSGNPESNYNDIEDTNNTGYALYPSLGDLTNDMGAFGGNGGINWVPNEDNITVIKPQNITINTYPNPFNPLLNVSLDIKNLNSKVNVTVFNIKGQIVKNLYNDIPKGNKIDLQWNGTNNNGHKLSSGIYFIKAVSNDENNIKKVLMLK